MGMSIDDRILIFKKNQLLHGKRQLIFVSYLLHVNVFNAESYPLHNTGTVHP